MANCVVRVWASGDMEDCGTETSGGDLCDEHLSRQIDVLEKQIDDSRESCKRFQLELDALKQRRAEFPAIVVSIADFSVTPGARTGPFSGEDFLRKVLLPKYDHAVSVGRRLLVDLDGTEGYAASFLDAAFGGLARERGSSNVIAVIGLNSNEEPHLMEEIMGYIEW